MNDSQEQDKKPQFMVPDREVFEVTRMGLPLNLKDNLTCGLVIMLAIALQIRLSGTFWSEGTIAFLGFIGYVALRYWLLCRRYTEPGEVIIEGSRLHLPASINSGVADSFELSNCIVKIYVMGGRTQSYSSIVFRHGCQQAKINWLAIELTKLEQALLARNISAQKEIWTPAVYAVGIMVLAIVVLIIFLALSGH